MSIAHHHAEWLSLVPVSGPFLSLPVLLEALPLGLAKDDDQTDHSRLLRQEYADWQYVVEKRNADPAPHQHWIKFVLNQTLDLDEAVLLEGQAIPQTLQIEVPEHHELLRPSYVVNDPATNQPRLLIKSYQSSQDLTSYVANSPWKASPDTRMTELLHATGVRLGLITNGEHWMLVDAPKGETTGYASWYASLWLDEPITLRAFRTLLSAERFFGEPDRTLESLLVKSASNQQDVTDQLGYQVRRAVEVLIADIAKIEHESAIDPQVRELVAQISPTDLYESSLTVMMRLVFLFCAEERELIPSKPFPAYDQNYSVSAIGKQLRELTEDVHERRLDAWPRLLAAFRAVYGGLSHDDVHIPAYGGSLFNPDRFPFLEGRKPGTSWRDTPASPLPVNNRTVLHLLEALQLLQIKVPGGGPAEARRLSFRALDIEQIGHVYEGLLDHTAKRAAEPFLGLAGTRDKEPEFPLAELETLAAKGEADLVKFLKEHTGRSESALKKAVSAEFDGEDVTHFRTACQNDDALWNRVKPFAGLVRRDNFGYPVVIPKGSVFVTAGTDRRSSGTHYTPRSLTEPIVQYTLEPLVYVGPAEGKPKDQWQLKSARELLDLKICDMACGSGAFLVQSARYMAERLLEAWDAEHTRAQPGQQSDLFAESAPSVANIVRITPFGYSSDGGLFEQVVPLDPAERKTYAMRIIAQRCLYGVDKNPLAAEMAKLSLWLLTLAKDKPFEFLDHSIRCGDSLVGLHSIDQMRHYSLKPDADDAVLFKGPLDSAVDEAIDLRLKLEDMPANTVEDVQRQEKLLIEANEKIARLRSAADLLVAAEFWGENARDKQERVRHAAVKSGHYVEKGPTDDFEQIAAKERRGQTMFHWPLEFPEVIVKRGGFDGFVGNPPFLGGTRVSNVLGVPLNSFIKSLHTEATKFCDLSAHFVRRAYSLLHNDAACIGMIATNTIGQGDSRMLAFGPVDTGDGHIIRAFPTLAWPSTANVHVAIVFVYRGGWNGSVFHNDCAVANIDSHLSVSESEQSIDQLAENDGLCFIGSKPMGMGWFLDEGEAEVLRSSDPRHAELVLPMLNGKEINSRLDHSPERWALTFYDWTLAEAEQYPQCMRIVRDRIKPERDKIVPTNPIAKQRRDLWWKYSSPTVELYAAARKLGRVLARSRVSGLHMVAWVRSDILYNDAVVVFAFEDDANFAVLQSSIHDSWLTKFASTLKSDVRYKPRECFGCFPRPKPGSTVLCDVGKRYAEHRACVLAKSSQGLTKTYNRFHDSDETSADIQKLRELHVEMDQAVAAAYGWTDLELGHGFHDTKQGVRFTISEPARREVLQRLLKLNHERYAEEVKQGLHAKKGRGPGGAGRGKKAKVARGGPTLFGNDDDEPEPSDAMGEASDVDETSVITRPRSTSNRSADEAVSRPTPIEELATDEIMAAFRQAARGRGSLERDELLKEASLILGFRRLGPKIEEALRGHLRAAIRRGIIEADGADLVRAATTSMADYDLEALRESFRSVMRKGANYEREEVIHDLARYLGFARVTDTSRDAIKSAINSAIRQGILGYDGNEIWRED